MSQGKGEMTLWIDPSGGIAGDMFAAALISAGADSRVMKAAMLSAAGKLGKGRLKVKKTPEGYTQIHMKLQSLKDHLGENEAGGFLNQLFNEWGITEKYLNLGNRILRILLEAEKKAHARHHIIIPPPDPAHHHPHAHTHHHHEAGGTFLHEAQDIIIDIMGTVMGMQTLGIEPRAMLLNPVSVGGGTIDFSHGRFDVPAPATKIILETHGIPWTRGPIDRELCTPTGAAILAALDVGRNSSKTRRRFLRRGRSRGTHPYDIPALEIFIY